MAFDIGAVVAHIKADLSNFTAGIEEAKSEANSLGENIGNVAGNIRSFAEQAGLFVGAETAAFGLLAKQAIDVAANFEQTQTSFGTLLGSEQKAADLMKQIMEFEQHTPFDISTLTDAAKQLLAMGVSYQDIVPKIKEFTDISQGSSEKLSQMASIYGQINSLQHVNGMEILRLARDIQMPILQELADHYNMVGGAVKQGGVEVNAYGETVTKVSKNNADVLAAANTKLAEQNTQLKILQEEHPKTALQVDKHNAAITKLKDQIAATTTKIGDHTLSLKSYSGQTKVTTADVMEMIKKGQVSVQDFDAVLKEVTSKGGLYFNENIRQMNTFNGIMSSVRSQFQYAVLNMLGIDLGAANEVRKGGLFDTLKTIAADLLDGLHRLQPVLKAIGENKTFQLAIEGMVIAIASLAIIIPVLIVALNPVILIVLAIEAAIVALYMAWNTNFLGIRDITTTVGKYIMDFWTNALMPKIKELSAWWHDNWQYIADFLMGIWFVIEGILKVAIALVIAIIRGGIDLLTGNWKDFWKTMGDIVSLGWDGIKNILEGALIMVTNAIALIVQALIKPFQDAWNTISGIMNKIKDAIDFTKRHSPSVIDIIENGVQLANDALGKLAFNTNMTVTNQSFVPGSGGVISNQITINLDGAIIADSQSAQSMAEKIGDSLINKLKLNIRF